MPSLPSDSLFDGHSGPRVAIVAGEASGDLLGASLIQAVRRRMPEVRFAGIAGPKMQSAGAKSLFPMSRLAVMGYVEVIKRLRELLGIRATLRERCLQERPDLFIGIDAPDFNLGLEKKLKDAGIPTVHYVSPSIWAWRGERVYKIKAATNEVLCLFPFEKQLYDAVDAKATYVGHPLADSMPLVPNQAEIREAIGVNENQLVFTFLPGSRIGEVGYHAELFIETARLLSARYPEAVFLVPLVTRETRDLFDAARYTHKALDLPLRLMFGHAQEAMQAADVILVASGTATLEAMLAKRPMVITYKLSDTTYRMVRKKMRLPYVGLPNVIAGRFVVPELLQHEATPENLAQVLGNYVESKKLGAALTELFTHQHESLRQDAAERAADAVVAYLRRPA
ncbi:lipid-A-disaccharide synthase [Chitinimonas sp. BJB300]|uniref:lipid-A-disaccharide synthase n=1 Tax=Chitinimonas sp. BJB300 TaxID=1559339 RepID=UPI000C0F2095|nr:lipid-A-disaccharide synthase [Chitinimonas sp. BJB300]PHV13119.1 lipid-A-disaccharide synthase [Chitinimonas sp. BJB300]TSJ84716.1 lipid-A-disaccharide synthase [Chitinimonas sp. BJB300]